MLLKILLVLLSLKKEISLKVLDKCGSFGGVFEIVEIAISQNPQYPDTIQITFKEIPNKKKPFPY